jgi:hypothetical protein
MSEGLRTKSLLELIYHHRKTITRGKGSRERYPVMKKKASRLAVKMWMSMRGSHGQLELSP